MTRDFLMLGLSGSGKTTFLAALNWSLQNPPQEARLRSSGLADGTQYINERTKEWIRCQVVEKTPSGRRVDVTLPVETVDGDQAQLHCPDLSGEEFRDHWELRQWSPERDQEVRHARGLILFVSALHSYLPSSLAQEAQAVGGPEPAQGTVASNRAWTPEDTCLQVQIVELLQFIRLRRRSLPLKVAFVVSAWDRIAGTYNSAEDWLQTEAPLLHQFLHTNSAVFPSRAYGVSAQGGEYATQSVDLLSAGPGERIVVVHRDDGAPAKDRDITRPLAWLVDSEPMPW